MALEQEVSMAASNPNIISINCDDPGYGDLGWRTLV